MKIFSETITYASRSVLRLRDRSGSREVARVIEAKVGQRAESKKGSALNLRNLFFKKLSSLLYNVATLSCNETSRHWKSHILECHDVGSQRRDFDKLTLGNVLTLPCFYEHERSYSPHTQHEPSLVSSTFCRCSNQPHPSSSQQILETPKALSTFLDPKTLVPTFIWRSFLRSGFQVSLGLD